MADDFARYLEALSGSWRAFAAPYPEAHMVRRPDLVGLRHPDPVLNNAVVRSRLRERRGLGGGQTGGEAGLRATIIERASTTPRCR